MEQIFKKVKIGRFLPLRRHRVHHLPAKCPSSLSGGGRVMTAREPRSPIPGRGRGLGGKQRLALQELNAE